MVSKLTRLAAMAAAIVATTAILPGTALADPPGTAGPAGDDIAGVGSGTTDLVMNALTWGEDAPSRIPAPGGYNQAFGPQNVDSWNAWNGTNSNTITTKPGCDRAPALITRPPASSSLLADGIGALKAGVMSNTDPTKPCVDFARAVRAPLRTGAGDVDRNGNPLMFLPYATDGMRYATANPTPGFPSAPRTNAPQNLTTVQLRFIFANIGVRWSDIVPGASSDAIQKVMPLSADIRLAFEQQLGITDAQLPADVIFAPDNDPAVIRANPDRIGPFSTARFNHTASDQGIQLNGSGFAITVSAYNVVSIDRFTGRIPIYLQPFFGDGTGRAASTGSLGKPINWICTAQAKAIISSEGFTPLRNGPNAGDCGVAQFSH